LSITNCPDRASVCQNGPADQGTSAHVTHVARRELVTDVGDELSVCGAVGGRYWDRTSDLFGVNEALSR
jgi:hypothetical protein